MTFFLPLLCGATLIGFVSWLLLKRPHIFFAFFFIILTLVWKLTAAIYIDISGPLYAEQIAREIGPSMSSPILLACYLAILLPFLFVLRERRVALLLEELRSSKRHNDIILQIRNPIFSVCVIYLALLFLDLFRIGVIPVLEGLERYEYTAESSGPFHIFLVTYGNIFAFHLGVFHFYPKLHTPRSDNRFLAILLGLFVYCVLTGNRFSTFYSFGSCFLVPYGAVLLCKENQPGVHGTRDSLPRKIGRFFRLLLGSWKPRLILLTLVAFTSFGLYNNLTFVRGYTPEQAREKFVHRSLVQPAEIWWLTYERVIVERRYHPGDAFHFLFVDPIDSDRNTTIQYLMVLATGEELATSHARMSHVYAGGFPEIFFELFDVYFALPVLLVVGLVTAELLYQLLKAFLSGHFWSLFWTYYVLYALLVMFIGGMLNYLTNLIFWCKVTAMIVSIAWERRHRRQSIPTSGSPLVGAP